MILLRSNQESFRLASNEISTSKTWVINIQTIIRANHKVVLYKDKQFKEEFSKTIKSANLSVKERTLSCTFATIK